MACACGASLLTTGANTPLVQVVVVTLCNLHRWCIFIQPLVQILHLHSGNYILYICIIIYNRSTSYYTEGFSHQEMVSNHLSYT